MMTQIFKVYESNMLGESFKYLCAEKYLRLEVGEARYHKYIYKNC